MHILWSPHEHVHAGVGIVDGAKAWEESHDGDPYDAHPADALLYREDPVLGGEDGEGVTELPEDVEVRAPGDQGQGLPHAHRHQVAWGEDKVNDVERGQHLKEYNT